MKKIRALIAFALAILCIVPNLVPVLSAATEPPSSDVSEPNGWIFATDDDTTFRAVLSPSDLLTLLLRQIYESSSEPTQAELDYLDEYFDGYLFYNAILPPSLVSTEQTADGVTVTAKAYSYLASNGKTVTFLPVRATLDGRSMTLSASSDATVFAAEFSELSPTADLSSIRVYYQGSLTLPKEALNRLVTMAFDDASNALSVEQSMLDYTIALDEYQTYLRALEQYETDCISYESYLSALALYEEAVAEYEQNQRDWESFRQKDAVYQTYLSDLARYKESMALYDLAYAEYTLQNEQRAAYLKNLNSIRTSLVPMESLFLTPSDKKTGTLYRALQNGELVSMFEKYKGILSKNFGIPAKTITDLRADADRLNLLLGEYAEQRKISEEAAFASYKKNYTEIRDLFNSLYQRMNDILSPTVYTLICAKLDAEYGKETGAYKKWRIKNVLSHIYLICLCLDDTKNPDNTWHFYADDGNPNVYYFANLLAHNLIISDSNASDPTSLLWLPEVAEATAPTMPTEPPAVQKPIPPVSLAEPTPPTEISEPTEPAEVPIPTPPTQSDHQLVLRTGAICLALLDGTLTERTLLTEDPTLKLPELCLEKKLGAPSVYGAKGQLLSIDDPSTLPTPSEDSEDLPLQFEDPYYTYTFESWSNQPDAICAIYRRTERTYRATFVIDGVTVEEATFPMGSTPVFSGSTDKTSTETTDYVFTSWSPSLAPLYRDVEYVAKYREQPRKYTVTFAMANQSLRRQYEWNQTPEAPLIPPSYLSGASLYEFVAWDRIFSPVTESTTYTARYRELVLASYPNAPEGTVSLAPSSSGYVLVSSQNRISIGALVELAVSEGKRLEILFSEKGTSVTLDLTALQSLKRSGICDVVLVQHPTHGTAVRFLGNNDTELSLYEGQLRMRLAHPFETEKNIYLSAYYPSLDRTQSNVACTTSDTQTELIATPGIYYRPYQRFTLTLKVGDQGQAMTNATVYSAGEPLYLTLRPNANYRLASLTFTDPVSGTTVAADPEHLVMPAYDAILNVEFTLVEYTLEFIYHGKSIVQVLPFGATVVFPEIPTSFEEDGFFYTFIGWSSTASVVTGDAVYTANYYSIRVEDVADSGEGGAWRAVILKIILPIALIILLVLGILITLPLLFIKQKKQKTKTKKKPKKSSSGRTGSKGDSDERTI